MEELCEEICQQLEKGDIEIKTISIELKTLLKFLSNASSRFVDINPSLKENHFMLLQVKDNLKVFIVDEKLSGNLFTIYQALTNYIGLRSKYGEAADWYLKQEFDTHLNEVISQAIVRLSTLSL